MKIKRLLFVFAAGLTAGLVLAWGLSEVQARQGGAPGGEILLPLLIVGCIYMGYQLRQLTEKQTKRR